MVMLVFIFPGYAQAKGFNIPPNVFRAKNLINAQKQAKASRKPITIILSRITSTCPLLHQATQAALDFYKMKTVVVFVEKKDFPLLPEAVVDALQSSKTGRYYPTTIIFDVGLTAALAYIPYMGDKSKRQAAFNQSLINAKKTAKEIKRKRKEKSKK